MEPGKESRIATLFPGYFALVMATGIVSLAAHFHGLETIAIGLLWINISAYVVLWILTLIRFVRYRSQFLSDLTSHVRGVTFLTMVAGTCVLGTQFAVITPLTQVAEVLWFVGTFLWVILIYTFFTAVTVREPKPALENGITGAWLLATVATESICALGTLIAPQFQSREVILFISLSMYFLGAMLYILLIALILYRWMFFSMDMETLTPTYWINTGALAITTLAGCRLMLAADQWALLQELSPFIKGFTLFFWATGTWWIPLLIIIGIWRHVIAKIPLRYDPQFWGLVFPIGMYTVATFLLSKAIDLPELRIISSIFLYFSFLAWTVTFAGLIRSLISSP